MSGVDKIEYLRNVFLKYLELRYNNKKGKQGGSVSISDNSDDYARLIE